MHICLGENVPTATDAEDVLVVIGLMGGCVWLAYFTGTMVQLLTNLDVMREMHRQKIGLINHFMRNEVSSRSRGRSRKPRQGHEAKQRATRSRQRWAKRQRRGAAIARSGRGNRARAKGGRGSDAGARSGQGTTARRLRSGKQQSGARTKGRGRNAARRRRRKRQRRSRGARRRRRGRRTRRGQARRGAAEPTKAGDLATRRPTARE